SGQYKWFGEGRSTRVNCAMVAERNQGKCSKSISSSSSPNSSQMPCGEMLVISTAEMGSPCAAEFIGVCPVTGAACLPAGRKHAEISSHDLLAPHQRDPAGRSEKGSEGNRDVAVAPAQQ